jgi:phage tail sheath protein FI
MAELTFRSPGVGTREIDLSGPTAIQPQGTPAGIIGTALQGPAFVPQTFATWQDFVAIFGATDGEKLGPLAMYEWMKNARAGTYLRVLGVGTGQKRLTAQGSDSDGETIAAGGVKNAGYTVGARLVKDNGYLGNNPYAHLGSASPKGRTYLLGAFMSQSAGSTYFTDAGMQGVVGGGDGADAIPIIRGIVMVPSGVIATLSCSMYTDNDPGSSAAHAAETGIAGGGVGGINITNVQNYNFVMLLNGHKDTEAYPNRITASLSPLNAAYLPNILNTDPLKIQQAGHLLYNFYNIHPNQAIVTGSGCVNVETHIASVSGSTEPAMFLLSSSLNRNVGSATIPNFESFADRFRAGFSPWITSQKFGSDYKNLFKIHALDDGLQGSENFRIQIENLKNGKLDDTFGQFDVLVKRVIPPDGIPPSEDAAMETFNGVNLDPSSDNYIARRIGDYNIYYDFDKMAGNQRVVVEGTHPNLSKYIRVQLHSDVTNRNIDRTALPLGYRGPYHLLTSGSSITAAEIPITPERGTSWFSGGANKFNQLSEPPEPIRRNIALGTDPKREVNARLPWGFQFEKIDSVAQPNRGSTVGDDVYAFTKYFPHFATSNKAWWQGDNAGALDSAGSVFDSDRFNNNVFSMERIQIHTKSTGDVVDPKEWAFAAYRRTGKLSGSLRKVDGTWDQGRFLSVGKDFSDPASTKFLKFTIPMQGGFNGVNILDKEKSLLSNLACVREMDDENQGQGDGPTVKTYMKALDVMAEKSDVDVQILAVPGIRETKVTDHALTKTEERFDAIYIMDIEERDATNKLVTASNIQPISVGNTVENFKSRVLDSSFGAAYFPDVLVTDPVTLTNVRCAPSVAVIGAFSHNDKIAYPWFAPAGFNRGALSRVVQSTVNLSRGNLDSLYDADINPITKFPTSEGVVIFGQKTLLAAASSLDRVNVRRLLIDIRRKVRRIADTFLFEPNREDTLARFSASVNPVLTRIQQQQGLDRFKVIIDMTTTTQADVENNTIRGKIFLQPTRSIEFISLDFVVTNNGTEI